MFFGVDEKLGGESADRIYDQIADCLTKPNSARALFERFNIEVLATTDAAHDPLVHHKAIRESQAGKAGSFRRSGPTES